MKTLQVTIVPGLLKHSTNFVIHVPQIQNMICLTIPPPDIYACFNLCFLRLVCKPRTSNLCNETLMCHRIIYGAILGHSKCSKLVIKYKKGFLETCASEMWMWMWIILS